MLVRFVLSNGKHFYEEVRDSLLDEIKESNSKHTFVKKDGHRFEYIGVLKDFPTLKQVDIVELKVANLAEKLMDTNIKLAADLIAASTSSDKVERFIDSIKIPENSPKMKQIDELKSKEGILPRDIDKVRVLWWEAKRDTLQDVIEEINLTRPLEKDREFLNEVLKELIKRVTESVRKYQNYPG